jgi:hypothetical protein
MHFDRFDTEAIVDTVRVYHMKKFVIYDGADLVLYFSGTSGMNIIACMCMKCRVFRQVWPSSEISNNPTFPPAPEPVGVRDVFSKGPDSVLVLTFFTDALGGR